MRASHFDARLYLTVSLEAASSHECSPDQSHYLQHVLRLKAGARLAVFDGKSGVFTARIAELRKKSVRLEIGGRVEIFVPSPDITLCFAPLKRDHLDWLVQKATELGVRRLRPVITRRTEVARVNIERLRSIAIEAAEQCERHDVPEILEPVRFEELIRDWKDGRLYACIERAIPERMPLAQAAFAHDIGKFPASVFITGPEGGFAPEEIDLLLRQNFVQPISLGPRILRAETAAITVLAAWQTIRDAKPD